MMFDVHGHHFENTDLVGTRSIVSFHDTSKEPTADVRRPIGNSRHQYTTSAVVVDGSTTGGLTPVAPDLCGAVR